MVHGKRMGGRKLAPILVLASMTLVAGCETLSGMKTHTAGALSKATRATFCQGAHCWVNAVLSTTKAGLAAAWGAMKVYLPYSEKIGDADEAAAALGYSRRNGIVVMLQQAGAAPKHIEAGQKLKLSMEYSVLAPEGEIKISVAERWSILKDGKTLINLDNGQHMREQGLWQSTITIRLPEGVKAGTYVARARVSAGSENHLRLASFYVDKE